MPSSDAPPLIQYWHDGNPPDYVVGLIDSFREKNRDMTHMVFNETTASEFISEYYSNRESEAFLACAHPAMQADYLRYCAVYALGGVYVDADMKCVAPLRPLLERAESGTLFHMVTDWHGRPIPYPIVHNGFFAFRVSGHDLLKLTIDVATTNIERRAARSVWAATGPGIFTSLNLLHSAGSADTFIQCFKGREEIGWIACEVAGDSSRVSDAFVDVRMDSVPEGEKWIDGIGFNLPYKHTGAFWFKSKADIYR